MTFEEILDQAVAMLQRRGRVTYRALKRRFDLDDDYIQDLKEELIHALHVAMAEDDRVLVWTKHAEGVPDLSSQPGQVEPQPTSQQEQRVHAESPLIDPPTPDAERRQLTVMFCDLAALKNAQALLQELAG